MKKLFPNLSIVPTVGLALLAASTVSAATHYVSLASTSPVPPYTNWVTAATNIQHAVNAAAASDTVLVTNGVYPGGVTVTNPLTLVSVNGPQVTVINGGGTNRCVYLTEGASMTGFTLTNGPSGYPHSSGGGGGAYCSSTNVFLTNCVVTGNHCRGRWANTGGPWGIRFYPALGGGVYRGTLYNCILTGNSADFGGGASDSILYNCTLSGNWSIKNMFSDWSGSYVSYGRGGGVDGCTLDNCIIYFNSGTNGANYYTGCILNYCCTTPLPTNGVGNITNAPLFVDTNGWRNLHLQTNSPGINAGNNDYVATTTDLDGNPRIAGGTVDMGACEFQPCITGGQFCDAACSRLTGFSFTFSGAIVGQPYRIQTSLSLAAGSWTDLTNFIYTGPIVITDPSAVAGARKFYRAACP